MLGVAQKVDNMLKILIGCSNTNSFMYPKPFTRDHEGGLVDVMRND